MNSKIVLLPLQCPDFRPHLIEALISWCEERGQTPYMLVDIDDACEVPRQLANPDNTMVFCISDEAVDKFTIDEDAMSFNTRFGDQISQIYIPLNRIAAIYPKEDTNLVTYFPLTPTVAKTKISNVKSEPIDLPLFTKV